MKDKIKRIADELSTKTDISIQDKLPMEDISKSINNIISSNNIFTVLFVKTLVYFSLGLAALASIVSYFYYSTSTIVSLVFFILITLLSTGIILGLKNGLKGMTSEVIQLSLFSIETIKITHEELKNNIKLNDLVPLVMYQVIIPLIEKIFKNKNVIFGKTIYRIIESILFSFTKLITSGLKEKIKKSKKNKNINLEETPLDETKQAAEMQTLVKLSENIESIVKASGKPILLFFNILLYPSIIINLIILLIIKIFFIS